MPRKNNVLVSTAHGLMLVNRHEAEFVFGVGKQLLEFGSYEAGEVALLTDQIKHMPEGPVLLDIGANIGVHTLELARAASAKGGRVHSFEPQRIIFQMLMANVALNDLQNVFGRQCAVSSRPGSLRMPAIDYGVAGSFGSVELGSGRQTEHIGVQPDWTAGDEIVEVITIDSLALPRVDLMKIDVEGMELDVLEGSRETLGRCKPLLLVEHLKSGAASLLAWLQAADYHVYEQGPNYFALPRSGPIQVSGRDPLPPAASAGT